VNINLERNAKGTISRTCEATGKVKIQKCMFGYTFGRGKIEN